MSTSATNRKRQPAGTPTGGRFATETRQGAGVSLGQEPRTAGARTREERVSGIMGAITAEVAQPHENAEHWLDQVDRHLDNLDADEWEDEFCQPVARAIREGRGGDAEHLAGQLVDLDAQETRWRQEGYTEPTFTSDMEGSPYGPRIKGSMYDPNRTPAQIATLARHDLQEASRAGYLPREATFRVLSNREDGGGVQVIIEGCSEEYLTTPTDEHPYAQNETALLPSQANRIATERAEAIVNQYTSRWVSTSHDFSQVSTYAESRVVTTNQAVRGSACPGS